MNDNINKSERNRKNEKVSAASSLGSEAALESNAATSHELSSVQKRLAQSERRFQLLVNSVVDYAIFIMDSEGCILSWNEGAQRLKGYTAEEIIGKNFSIFYTPEDRLRRHPEYELEKAKRQGRYGEEGWRVRKDGSRFWASTVISRLVDDDGNFIGFAKVTRDLSERKEMEEKLRKANLELEKRVKERTQQLEEAVNARDAFISIVSHELRTPITSLKLQLETAERQVKKEMPKSPTDERYLDLIERSKHQAERLARLIEDMLDVSRLATGRFSLYPVQGELCSHFEKLISGLEEQIKFSKSEFMFECHAPVYVECDFTRMEQVLLNLLFNALKYGAGKPVRVRVYSEGDKAVFSVEDQGTGIFEEDRKRIFEPFERGKAETGIGGIGMGLFISKEIVDAHHGTITVKSEPGKGSIFTVKFPLKSKISDKIKIA